MEKTKYTITKWLVTCSKDGYSSITRETSRYAPINRVLDQVGFYDVDKITVEGRSYLIVFDQFERDKPKTKMLITKINQDQDGEKMIDLTEDDRSDVMKIIELMMDKIEPSLSC